MRGFLRLPAGWTGNHILFGEATPYHRSLLLKKGAGRMTTA